MRSLFKFTSLFCVLLALSCSGSHSSSSSDSTATSSNPSTVGITGAGSTFVYPLMSKWTAEYANLKQGAQVNYQSIGSGAGISQVSVGTVDFGASDAPMNDQQIAASKVGKIIHIPVTMGAAVAAYNLPGVSGELRLTPDRLANIFLGKITKWDDPAIAKANPGQKLPSLSIAVIRRADGSGTSYIWTEYLTKVSPEWASKVGKNTAVSWPTGLGAKGS